jgi:hypothetical protein
MPRPRKWPPTIHIDQRWNRAYVRIYDAEGAAHTVTLGTVGSPEADAAYIKILQEHERGRTREGVKPPAPAPRDISIAEVLVKYLTDVVNKRVDGGKLSESQRERIKRGLLAVADRHGAMCAHEFTAKRLEEVRQDLLTIRRCRNCDVAAARAKKEGQPVPERCQRCREQPGLCKKYTNALVGCVIKCFRWAACEGLVPESVHGSLLTLEPLKLEDLGRDSTEVLPADMADVEKILPLLPTPVAAVVRLQILTGARPTELLKLRPCDLDKSGRIEIAPAQWVEGKGVWSYRPKKHKNSHKGHPRLILFGPTAQAILQPFLDRDPEAFLFSPREAMAEWRTRQRRERASKVQPSQANRKKARRKKEPGERYEHGSFRQCVQRACDRAGVARWFPYQLRHNAAARLFAEYGNWDIVRIILGHRSLDTTRIYAPDELGKATKAIGQSG